MDIRNLPLQLPYLTKMIQASFLLPLLKLFMIIACSGWVSLWLLKPTNFWNERWKKAEESARDTLFGYYGLNFAVYTFPMISVASIGFIYLSLHTRQQRRRQTWSSVAAALSNPVVSRSLMGILSSAEIFAVFLFILYLAWSLYERISNDFSKLLPVKSIELELWQLKCERIATRFGLLAEACMALLLFPVLRGLSVFQLLGLQFEASVRYHIWLGTATILFATLHSASMLFVWGVSGHIQDQIWRWQRTGRINLAGEVAFVTGLVMWMTSVPQVRRKRFEFFYYTHHLYIIFLVFFLFHVGDGHFYWVFPGVFLFGLDKLLRILQSRPQTYILSATLFPCKAVQLLLPKEKELKYTPTSTIFMKIPSISRFQWHSFSIASSSAVDDCTMLVICKCEGKWTTLLYNMIESGIKSVSDSDRIKGIDVAIEGPYGPISMEYLRYSSLLLVAGGIGITPFLSIMQEIFAAHKTSIYKIPTRIQLIYVVKKSQEISLLNSISDIFQEQPSQSWNLSIRVFVTQENQSSAKTLGEVLNNLDQTKTIQFGKEGPIYSIHGHESLLWMTALTLIASFAFMASLIALNHIFIHSDKKHSSSMKIASATATIGKKTPTKEKNPSWVADLLVLSSFAIALASSFLVAALLRWRRVKQEIPPHAGMNLKEKEPPSVEEHQHQHHHVQFGGRPNLADLFSEFADEEAAADIGVLVCGPESMKESAASICRKMYPCMKIGSNGSKHAFYFHSLNFTL